jgi:hypothetical protein
MDAKLEAEAKEFPSLTIRFECSKCGIEFTQIIKYREDREEYLKFKDLIEKARILGDDDEMMEEVIFMDLCKDCRKK